MATLKGGKTRWRVPTVVAASAPCHHAETSDSSLAGNGVVLYALVRAPDLRASVLGQTRPA